MQVLLSMLRAPGAGPLVVRIGGDSADHSFWRPRPRPAPGLGVRADPALDGERVRAGRRVRTPADPRPQSRHRLPGRRRREWARAARSRSAGAQHRRLRDRQRADIYNHHFWTALTAARLDRRPDPAAGADRRQLPRGLLGSTRRALRRVAPGVPLLGPRWRARSHRRRWVATLLAGHPPGLSAVSVHRYPYSACAHPGARRRSRPSAGCCARPPPPGWRPA